VALTSDTGTIEVEYTLPAERKVPGPWRTNDDPELRFIRRSSTAITIHSDLFGDFCSSSGQGYTLVDCVFSVYTTFGELNAAKTMRSRYDMVLGNGTRSFRDVYIGLEHAEPGEVLHRGHKPDRQRPSHLLPSQHRRLRGTRSVPAVR